MIYCFMVWLLFFTPETPENYFYDTWQDAEYFTRINSCQASETLIKYNQSPAFAFSIVFPEIIRYNLLRDFFETSVLETGYVLKGSAMLDFSIGYFQMKPSFAEQVENFCDTAKGLNFTRNVFPYPIGLTSMEIRAQRVKRLKSKDWQLTYLAAFCCIMDYKFRNKNWDSDNQKLIFYASAYNHGFTKSASDIEKWSNVLTFPYGLSASSHFSYASISVHFFEQYASLYFPEKLSLKKCKTELRTKN